MHYDDFQQKAINYINEGFSVIVSAPTGAGKTVIAEHVINDCLAKDLKAIYTAPIKALSNQKFRDFQEHFGDKIGILTGDVSINPLAPILIMTTEIFRNKILGEVSSLDGYSWIIFDEVHYLDNYERGTVWEESIMFLPEHMKILALSATIPNINELVGWIESVHKKPVRIVKEDNRPVPLHFIFQHEDRIINNIHDLRFPKRRRGDRHRKNFRDNFRTKPNKLGTMIRELENNKRLPCIFFVFGRRRCEYLAEELQGVSFTAEHEKKEILRLYDDLCERFDLKDEKSASEMRPIIERGIAYHHAGMLPTLKEVVERLFTSKLIKIIFTTETFALGINMPARTVVFDELRKFYGDRFANLKTRDFYQMAGRAGRRGIDTEGFVYSRINPLDVDYPELKRMIYGEPEKVCSRFNASYATILNLYDKHSENLYDIYPRSFHYFQERQNSHKRAVDFMRRKVEILKDLSYIKNGALTQKGRFASKVYGYELALSELHEEGILDHLPAVDLGILFIALIYEPRKNMESPEIPKNAHRLRHITDGVMARINKREHKLYLPLSKNYYYHLTTPLEMWMMKEPFEVILRHTQADEGEVIRTFRMSIQIFREILETNISHDFKDRIHKALQLINRDIIDAEKQLRVT
ncbi:MAG TPA: DEAD/DEAH box helicase [Candidatus Omnitrophota bacterium]|nr:DEAD/DEAH box helicase [Candidatus Omnitrophota bacterium]HPS20769.1 DEAD/DEAH box helicase [Candidatus Omnitrophota bacterium]